MKQIFAELHYISENPPHLRDQQLPINGKPKSKPKPKPKPKSKPKPGMIFHSDRGVQYACQDFRTLLATNRCVQSMSRKGNCWDNAVAESFFKTIKTECIHKYEFTTKAQAYSIIFDYIDGWYNTKRIHSANAGLAPAEMFDLLGLKKTAA